RFEALEDLEVVEDGGTNDRVDGHGIALFFVRIGAFLEQDLYDLAPQASDRWMGVGPRHGRDERGLEQLAREAIGIEARVAGGVPQRRDDARDRGIGPRRVETGDLRQT